MEVFEFNGIFYIIPKLKYEIREVYIERVWYILHHMKDNKIDDKLLLESRIWSNTKHFGCQY